VSTSAVDDSLLIRTDFTDDAAWNGLCYAIRTPVGEFRAYISIVDNPLHDEATVEEIVHLTAGKNRSFVFVADRIAICDSEHPILVVDLLGKPGRTFRVIPVAAWSVENNLSIGNMDFAEFVEGADARGIFRGFPTQP
jgi:hypothetical protein